MHCPPTAPSSSLGWRVTWHLPASLGEENGSQQDPGLGSHSSGLTSTHLWPAAALASHPCTACRKGTQAAHPASQLVWPAGPSRPTLTASQDPLCRDTGNSEESWDFACVTRCGVPRPPREPLWILCSSPQGTSEGGSREPGTQPAGLATGGL